MTSPSKLFCALAAVCVLSGPHLAAAPPAAPLQPAPVTHVLKTILLTEDRGYRFIWTVPDQPGRAWTAPPKDWVSAIPSGDLLAVNMPYYTDTRWQSQYDDLVAACKKRHVTVTLVRSVYTMPKP